MTIREAEPKDRDAVLALSKSFATSFTVEERAFRVSFAEISASETAFFAVAEFNEMVVGYVLAFRHPTFYANGNVAWVEELMVNSDYRREGIGTALMESVEKWAADSGCALVALATRRASSFYEAIDYEASATYFRKLM